MSERASQWRRTRSRAPLWWTAGLLVILALPIMAASPEEPEVRDQEGDVMVPQYDISAAWFRDRGAGAFDAAIELVRPPTREPVSPGDEETRVFFVLHFVLKTGEGERVDPPGKYRYLEVEHSPTDGWGPFYVVEGAGNIGKDGQRLRVEGKVHGDAIIWTVEAAHEVFDVPAQRLRLSDPQVESIMVRFRPDTRAWPHVSQQVDRAPDSGTGRAFVIEAQRDLQQDAASGVEGLPFLTAFGVAVVLALVRILRQQGRTELLQWLAGLGLFTRIERDEVLSHKRRAKIHGFLQEHPGSAFADLRRVLGIGSGSLAHHLAVLERQGLVGHRSDGRRRRYFIHQANEILEHYLPHARRRLLVAVARVPGVTQSELARSLQMSRHMVQYHTGRLVADGLLRRRREGRFTCYYAPV